MGILDERASWTIGFQAANLGSKLDGQKLPARLGLGGAIDLPFSMDNRLQVALDRYSLLRHTICVQERREPDSPCATSYSWHLHSNEN